MQGKKRFGLTFSLENYLSFYSSGKKCCNEKISDENKMTCKELRKYFKKKMKREEKKSEKKKSMFRKSKKKSSLDLKKDYKYLLSVMNEMKRAKPTTNEKCGVRDEGSNPHMFRNGKYIIQPRCHKKQCRSKDPTPAGRRYKRSTIEFGIVIDKYMFEEMKVMWILKKSNSSNSLRWD